MRLDGFPIRFRDLYCSEILDFPDPSASDLPFMPTRRRPKSITFDDGGYTSGPSVHSPQYQHLRTSSSQARTKRLDLPNSSRRTVSNKPFRCRAVTRLSRPRSVEHQVRRYPRSRHSPYMRRKETGIENITWMKREVKNKPPLRECPRGVSSGSSGTTY